MKIKTTHLLGLLAGSLLLANLASATVTTVAYYRLGENDPGATNGGPANPVTHGYLTPIAGGGYLTNYPDLAFSGTNCTYSTNTGVNGSTLSLAMDGGQYMASQSFTGGNQYCIEAWVNGASSLNGDAQIAYNGNYAANGMGIIIRGTTYAGYVGSVGILGTTAIVANTWTHLAIVYDSTQTPKVTFYVNGVQSGSTRNNAVKAPTPLFAIGTNVNALIDEVRVFTFDPGTFSTNDLELTNVPPALPQADSWTGGNGVWDINDSGNLIWEDSSNASTYYQEGGSFNNFVEFDNTTGSGGTVTLNTMVSPSSVMVNNPTADYTISGSGAIAGSGSLTKDGAGTLTLTTTNAYTGATMVNGGTLALSSGGTLPVASALSINGGTLDLGTADATNSFGNTGIAFGDNGGNLNGSGIFSIVGTSTGAIGLNVAANATAVVNENLWVTNNLANSYQALASVGSGGTLTINGQIYSQTSGNGIWLQGGGTLVLNNPTNQFSIIGMWQTCGTISTPYFSALGTGNGMVVGHTPTDGPATFIYTGAATTNAGFMFRSPELYPTILNNGGGVMVVGQYAPYGTPSSGTAQTLTLGGSSDITFLGVIQDANPGAYITDLVKTNTGTLTLDGINTYSGGTTISEGTLVGVTGGSCPSSDVTLAAAAGDTAALGVSITDNTTNWTIPSLTVNNGGTSSDLQFNFGALLSGVAPSTTVAPLNVVGNAFLSTTPGITITANTLPVSSGNGYPLMTWGGGGPTDTSGMTLTLPSGAAGNLAVVGNTLYLQVTTGIYPTPQAPVFSPAGGVYYGAQTVTITSDDGSTIHYTTDGSDPTTSGTVVSGASPVSVNVPANDVNETLRAYTSQVLAASPNSAVSSQSYNTTLSSAPAAQPMVTEVNDGPLRNDLTGTVGYTFTTSTNLISVTALGYEDWTGQGTSGSGLWASHIVALWDSSGNLIASVTVPAGTAGSYLDDYWYAPLNPVVTLAANATYTIGVNEVAGGDYWPGSAGTYFPGFSMPLFAGMADLSPSNNVYGTTYPTVPLTPDNSGPTSIWLPCNLQGSSVAVAAVQPVKLVNGSVQFSALGTYGAGYRIWASTNLALTPITSTWSNVSSGTFNGSSVIYTDTGATNYPARFYTITSP